MFSQVRQFNATEYARAFLAYCKGLRTPAGDLPTRLQGMLLPPALQQPLTLALEVWRESTAVPPVHAQLLAVLDMIRGGVGEASVWADYFGAEWNHFGTQGREVDAHVGIRTRPVVAADGEARVEIAVMYGDDFDRDHLRDEYEWYESTYTPHGSTVWSGFDMAAHGSDTTVVSTISTTRQPVTLQSFATGSLVTQRRVEGFIENMVMTHERAAFFGDGAIRTSPDDVLTLRLSYEDVEHRTGEFFHMSRGAAILEAYLRDTGEVDQRVVTGLAVALARVGEVSLDPFLQLIATEPRRVTVQVDHDVCTREHVVTFRSGPPVAAQRADAIIRDALSAAAATTIREAQQPSTVGSKPPQHGAELDRRFKSRHSERSTPENVSHDQHQSDSNPFHRRLARRRKRDGGEDGS